MSNQPHNDNSQPFDGLEPKLAHDDPLERRLLADGARWRARTAPPVEPFAQRVNVALRESLLRADTSVEERPMSQRIVTPPPRVTSQPPRRRPGAWSTLVAVAAAVAIVAMLAWVFQAMPHAHVASKSATPTPSPVPHVTHPRGHWADVVQYTLSSNGSLYVAPSDPRIAYRTGVSPSDPSSLSLARTSDGGATWTTLALPTDDGGGFGGLAVSPLDPQMVFLTLVSDQSNPHCPVYALPPGADVGPTAFWVASAPHADAYLGPLHPTSGGYSCSFQYVSRDGGAHWSHPQFPWKAQHLADMNLNPPVQVQGTTLFASVAGNLNGEAFDGVRLAVSTDGGTSWRVADADIVAAGQIVTSYAAIPGTTTVYAMSVAQQTPFGQETSAALWRSDDAGVHWSHVGKMPLMQARLIGTISPDLGPVLYATGIGSSNSRGSLAVYASRDGGRTWSQAPITGQPQRPTDNPPGIPIGGPLALTTLADGSLLVVFFDQPSYTPTTSSVIWINLNPSLYAWRPGDAGWFEVAPRPGGGPMVQSWITSPANGPQTLWIVMGSQQGSTVTVRKCVLE